MILAAVIRHELWRRRWHQQKLKTTLLNKQLIKMVQSMVIPLIHLFLEKTWRFSEATNCNLFWLFGFWSCRLFLRLGKLTMEVLCHRVFVVEILKSWMQRTISQWKPYAYLKHDLHWKLTWLWKLGVSLSTIRRATLAMCQPQRVLWEAYRMCQLSLDRAIFNLSFDIGWRQGTCTFSAACAAAWMRHSGDAYLQGVRSNA